MPAIDLSILNQRQTPAFYADVFANRPAAGFVGRIFVSTNTFAFYRDNGTSWDLIGGPGTGTITGSGSFGSIALWNGTDTITYDVGLTWDGTANSLTASKFIVTGGTSSQFLKGDGSLDSNTYNTGSGAASQVAFFSGTNAITGENNLWWDSTNNHLGINTNTPATALDVNHNGTLVAKFNNTTSANSLIAFENAGNEQWWIGTENTNNDFLFYDATNFPTLSLRTTFKTNGQVLIGGGSTGSGKLVVESATSDNGIQIVGANAPSLRIDSAATGPTKRIGLGISTGVNNFIQGSVDRDMCIFNGSTTASPILFGIYDTTNVQEAARISPARNLIVGKTTDSGERLQISGTALITSSTTINGDILSTRSVVGGLNEIAVINTATSGASGSRVRISTAFNGGTTLGDALTQFTDNNNFNWSIGSGVTTSRDFVITNYFTLGTAERFRISASTGAATFSGLVSASEMRLTAAPTNALLITPTLDTNASILNVTNAAQSVNWLSVGTGGKVIMNGTGNVLIGTETDAGQKLQVNGTARITGITSIGSTANNNALSSNTILRTTSGSTNSGASIGNCFAAAGSGSGYDTGISINMGTTGGTMLLMASINTSTGTSTNSAVYIVRFYFDGNNAPTTTYLGGSSDFVTFSVSGSNTLILTASNAGNRSYSWFINKLEN
jgi:hypothetical protein